ncbi:hypothetical protein GJ744_011816 [Endocarpon pusillum]|uniref:Arf-GAP domain-containing protein n=1 Tax=Endocarpon pusillum TaxID=364733 RepID=A0A8H7E2H9_9EURO|nr:hypothetical protein GJ744_011816 [Endocarpon pusillum]
MTASMSKRQLARNERDLQDLVVSVPGNDRCADCQARNPGWASWSLGIFLCMRCAALHRKLGTHISKVKSLSMDTWSTDQVENMRHNGNTSVNKIYNPKNTKPGIPLDVDEVDMAMERFIRQKYQERSLADGKPLPPSRDEISVPARSPQPSPTPSIHIQPQKRGKIFGFKLRASSSAYPTSKRDTRNLPPLEPTIENAFRNEVHSNKPSKPRVSGDSEKDKAIEDKLAALREMGFPDDRRNAAVLNRLSGDLTRTVESLVRLGEGGPDSRKTTPAGSRTNTPSGATFPDNVKSEVSNEARTSNNPFDPPARADTLAVPQAQGQAASYNPFDVQNGPRSAFQPMDQAFQAMQISQPLFPHSTGGYPVQQPPTQDPRFQHSMTPPVPHASQQYGYTSSPSTMYTTNPFLQPIQQQNTGVYDSCLPSQQNWPYSAPATNPFFNQQSSYEAAPTPPPSAPLQPQRSFSNPFGIPPSPQNAPLQQQQYPTPIDHQQTFPPSNAMQQSFYQQQSPQSHMQPPSQNSIPSQQPQVPSQHSPNPYQPQFQSPMSPHFHQQPSPLGPQQTGRIDKKSILALYDYPHLAPQPMPAIPDNTILMAETVASNPFSVTAPQNPYQESFTKNAGTPARRSATMPTSSTSMSHSTAGAGSNNPFLSGSNDISRQSSAVPSPAIAHAPPVTSNSIMHRHASQESVSLANLESGRHSPDAFANLSARFVRG